MIARAFFLAAVGLPLVASDALALKEQVRVAPKNQHGYGIAVAAVEQVDGQNAIKGALVITVARDLAKSRSHSPDSELQVERTTTLEVYGDEGLIARCQLEPVPDKGKNAIVYRFIMSRDHAARSWLTIAELDDYKDERNPSLLGGGTFYRIHLADFLSE